MTYINLMDGLTISIISMAIVFVLLSILSLIIHTFQFIFKQKLPLISDLPILEDEELKTVAALTALIMVNENNNNKTYKIESIERVN